MSSPIEIPDQAARTDAVNPTISCIVQAPAGSGKTTLLVERYLNLIAQCETPENILAITFTKKAAAEMRHRIIRELDSGSQVAEKVVQASDSSNWDLAQNHHRLRVQTIDSFALEVVTRAPGALLPSNLAILENPAELYTQAASRLWHRLLDNQPEADTIADFLAFFDNDANKATTMLTTMLSRRDQWLDLVVGLALGSIESEPEQLFQQQNQAIEVLRQVHLQALEDHLNVADQLMIEQLADTWGVSAEVAEVLPYLLTKSGALKKRITVKDEIDDKQLTKDASAWVKDLHERGVAEHFNNCGYLPKTLEHSDDLRDLNLCCVGLSLAAAALDQIFQQHSSIDFTGVMIHAKNALHDEQGATDLAQLLDYQINHILVDEFQDTSRSQLEFFELLTAGWQEDDGNSFFAVGDPMQSIYRFRDADVTIFGETAKQGLASKPLKPIKLVSNFRSDAALVEWNNQQFSTLFPQSANMNLGQITFDPATAMRTQNQTSLPSGAEPTTDTEQAGLDDAINTTAYSDKTEELRALVLRIEQILQTEADSSIAVLCRARNHVYEAMRLLSAQDIAFQATDIYPLKDELIVRDLFSLYRCILEPSNPIGWFGILRSPMVGLELNELYQFRQGPFPEVLQQATLSRLARLQAAINWWQKQLHERSLREVVEGSFLRCGGLHAYSAADQTHAQAFLDTLESLGHEALDPKNLEHALSGLFADSQHQARVQIMTIHKSKGLEFDHVFLPSLESGSRNDSAPLLNWRQSAAGLLLGLKGDAVHGWIQHEEKARSDNETKRLLYVACTRAKRTLSLSCMLKEDPKNPGEYKAAPELAQHFQWTLCESTPALRTGHASPAAALDELHQVAGSQRLPENYRWAPPRDESTNEATENAMLESLAQNETPEDQIGHRYEVALGNLVHRVLAWISEVAESHRSGWQTHLLRWSQEQQVEPHLYEQLQSETRQQVQTVLDDPTGQWILHAHPGAQSEFSLVSRLSENKSATVVIDRTFYADGSWWIIDYKTATPKTNQDGTHQTSADATPNSPTRDITAKEGEIRDSVAGSTEFFTQQAARYQPQLRLYQRVMAQLHPGEPIRTALYFTGLGVLHELNL